MKTGPKRPRLRNRKRKKNEAQQQRLTLHREIQDRIKAEGWVKIGNQECTTVGQALTAMGL